jgi:hypothetical protein
MKSPRTLAACRDAHWNHVQNEARVYATLAFRSEWNAYAHALLIHHLECGMSEEYQRLRAEELLKSYSKSGSSIESVLRKNEIFAASI